MLEDFAKMTRAGSPVKIKRCYYLGMKTPQDKDKSLIWTELSRTTLWQNHIFSLIKTLQRSDDGREGNFTIMECPDWVNVLAINTKAPRPQVLLVRQYRVGGAFLSLEFPGGMVEPKEAIQLAAARELKEECGCTASYWEELGSINPNPSFMANTTHSWLALDLDETMLEQSLDAMEILHWEFRDLEDLLEGRIPEFERNAIMMTTWYWFQKWLKKNPGRIPGY